MTYIRENYDISISICNNLEEIGAEYVIVKKSLDSFSQVISVASKFIIGLQIFIKSIYDKFTTVSHLLLSFNQFYKSYSVSIKKMYNKYCCVNLGVRLL